jgi:hypothetical protein
LIPHCSAWRRFGEPVRDVVAGTLGPGADVDVELRVLFETLGG